MKKSVLSVMSVMAVAVCLLFSVSGCKVQPEQIKVVAQNAGLFSAVGWIAMDNPDAATKNIVVEVLKIIEEKSSEVQAGATYTQVIYPELVKFIDSDKVLPQYRPFAKAGSLSLLGGIDILFATHPEWKADQTLAIQVIDAFVLGAKNGLSLAESHPVMEAARNCAVSRSKVFQK